jgi:hypothetical protein
MANEIALLGTAALAAVSGRAALTTLSDLKLKSEPSSARVASN